MAFDGVSRIEQAETAFFVANTLREINDIFHEKGESFDEEDAAIALTNPPELPHFPFFMVSLMAIKDTTDAFDLTLFGIIGTTLFTLAAGLIYFFWMWGKVKGRWWKKHVIRWIIRRAFLVIGIELLPFLKMIPMSVIFVLMAHYHETKIVRLFNVALEIMHARGIGRIA